VERKSFFDRDHIIADIKAAIEQYPHIDYLTFSGSGEPTLNKDLEWLIEQVKSFSDKKVAVITNSSLLWSEDVRRALNKADLVLPSLDAVTENIWLKINRPDPALNLSEVLEGLKIFCKEHPGRIWLEVMFTKGLNDTPAEIKKIADFVNTLPVERVQLNTVVRPPNEREATPLTQTELEQIKTYFTKNTEIIASFKKTADSTVIDNKPAVILELLSRRPCKPQEMADSLGLHLNEISKYLQKLETTRQVIREDSGHYSLYH
jgi:wyosine [tRNA(Phe)-imidazoG37] synthetase (radical SAM superfamily)